MFPILVELPWGPAHSYGTLIALGGLITMPGVWWDLCTRNLAESRRLAFFLDLYIAIVFGGALGGRTLHILTMPARYLDDPSQILALDSGGFVFFGALIGIALGWLWLSRRYDVSFATLSDIAATWVPLGHALGRLGCFAAGCCWGAPTDVSWGLRFPPQSVVALTHGGPLDADGFTVALHPTQLYEALGLILLWAVLWFRRRGGPERPFVQTYRYALGYGLLRAGVEVFRGDQSRGWISMLFAPDLAPWLNVPADHPIALSISQAIAIVMLVVGALGLGSHGLRSRRARVS